MIARIQKILRQAIKDYEIQTILQNEDTLVTLLSADLYKATVIQIADQAAASTPRPSRPAANRKPQAGGQSEGTKPT